jgi:hypothetical protein
MQRIFVGNVSSLRIIGASLPTESKHASMQWKHSSSPSRSTKKFKVMQSAGKVMLTLFWDSQGVMLAHFQNRDANVNSASYCGVLLKLRDAIRRKRPGQLPRGVLLHHDNARPHTAPFKKYSGNFLSPGLAPGDFHLSGPLKDHLGGKRFADDEEVETELQKWLRQQSKHFCAAGFDALVKR